MGLALLISFVAVQINRKKQAADPMGMIEEMIDFTALLAGLEAAIVNGPVCSFSSMFTKLEIFFSF